MLSEVEVGVLSSIHLWHKITCFKGLTEQIHCFWWQPGFRLCLGPARSLDPAWSTSYHPAWPQIHDAFMGVSGWLCNISRKRKKKSIFFPWAAEAGREEEKQLSVRWTHSDPRTDAVFPGSFVMDRCDTFKTVMVQSRCDGDTVRDSIAQLQVLLILVRLIRLHRVWSFQSKGRITWIFKQNDPALPMVCVIVELWLPLVTESAPHP